MVLLVEIPAELWVPSTLEYVVDGTWGRLGVQEQFGETRISGSTNGLAVWEDTALGKTYLYVGASNGGVHLRVYDHATDRWSPRWVALTRPGSGYEGSQSIAQLAISADGRFLAVGQGNPSSYKSAGAPSQGIQLAEIQPGGHVQWLPVFSEQLDLLQGLKIRSLDWRGSQLLATSWDNLSARGNLVAIETEPSGFKPIEVRKVSAGGFNLNLDHGAGLTVVAGHHPERSGHNRIALLNQAGELNELQGELYGQYLRSLQAQGNGQQLDYSLAELSIHPQRQDGDVVVFIGSFVKDQIARVDRLLIDPATGNLEQVQQFNALHKNGDAWIGQIGSGQASNDYFYGNFSFKADLRDPQAWSVLVGGNHFLASIATAPTTSGGLVSVRFDQAQPRIETYLYGPRQDANGGALVKPFQPGQPHADSRTIDFYRSANGLRLLQSDDGGIWQLDPSAGSWWQSLTAPGLSTLEVVQADWSAASNAVISAYQDNASSLGYLGDSVATNLWAGDGVIALFDDAGDGASYSSYLSSQETLKRGGFLRQRYGRDGLLKANAWVQFYLQQRDGGPVQHWEDTAEYAANVEGAIFNPLIEENHFRQDDLVIAGWLNLYEMVQPNPQTPATAMLLRPLLAQDEKQFFTALDHQGSAAQLRSSSLYAAAIAIDADQQPEVRLYGRQSSSVEDASIQPLRFRNLSAAELTEAGPVLDLAHQAHASGVDTLYWLQGGDGLKLDTRNLLSTKPAEQVLRIRGASGEVQTMSLLELGLPPVEGDSYGKQALVLVPARQGRPAQLVIAGLSGIWATGLNADGFPDEAGFQRLPWQGVPEGEALGSYITQLKYNPEDDLLIAATLGQGSYLYSFSGQLGKRQPPQALLHPSNTIVPQRVWQQKDKRGNEMNQMITIQLDSRLQSKTQPTDIEVVLHDAKAWRAAMDFVSPYQIVVSDLYQVLLDMIDSASDASAQGLREMIAYNNILDPVGLAYRGGHEEAGELIFPFRFLPGSSIWNLVVNVRERAETTEPITLRYSVRLLAPAAEQQSGSLTLQPLVPFRF